MQQAVQCTGKVRAQGGWLRWLAAMCLAIGAVGPAWACNST